jgi:hypothetical protein
LQDLKKIDGLIFSDTLDSIVNEILVAFSKIGDPSQYDLSRLIHSDGLEYSEVIFQSLRSIKAKYAPFS